jgi:hypothetical protein
MTFLLYVKITKMVDDSVELEALSDHVLGNRASRNI